MPHKPMSLEQDDVIQLLVENCQLANLAKLSTFSQLEDGMRGQLAIQRDNQYGRNKWIGEGVECRVLQASGNTTGWQKGRIRINIEFIPDAVEPAAEEVSDNSPLDSLR